MGVQNGDDPERYALKECTFPVLAAALPIRTDHCSFFHYYYHSGSDYHHTLLIIKKSMKLLHSLEYIFICAIVLHVASAGRKKYSRKGKNDATVPVGAFCENRLSAFLVSENTRLLTNDYSVYEDVTESTCMKMCSDNKDKKGRAILCASFGYDLATFACTIYRKKSFPEGDLDTEAASGKRFFEKFCLADDAPSECSDSQFLRSDQSVMIGYAKNVSVAANMEECIAQCLSERFQCKSAMFFYNDGECITNTESAISQSTAYAREESDKVIYIQNGCPAALARQKHFELSDIQETETSSAFTTTESENAPTDDTSTSPAMTDNLAEGKLAQDQAKKQEKGSILPSVLLENQEKVMPAHETSDLSTPLEESNDGFYEDTPDVQTPPPNISLNKAEKISRALTKNGKRIRAEGVVSKSIHNPKSIKSQGLKAIKSRTSIQTRFASEETEGESEQVRPSALLVEQQQGEEKTMNERIQQDKDGMKNDALEKSIKRLKIKNVSPEQQEEHFSQWSSWSPCTKAGERRLRRRKCFNLRKCLGALMEVGECPNEMVAPGEAAETAGAAGTLSDTDADYLEDVGGSNGAANVSPPALPQMVVASDSEKNFENRLPPGILPKNKHTEQPLNTGIWSPWSGICQEFASGQPCKNHERIGFESRECLAIDQSRCTGPFFRYCTKAC